MKSSNLANEKNDKLNFQQLLIHSPLFDEIFYAQQTQQKDLDRSVLISHYLAAKSTDRFDPHPLFDSKFYQQQCPAVDWLTCNPLVHFLKDGWLKELSPHPLFDTKYYLSKYPDVAVAGVIPVIHYLDCGASEMRRPCAAFDPIQYVQEPDFREENISNPLLHFVTQGATRSNRFVQQFDAICPTIKRDIQSGDNSYARFELIPNGLDRKVTDAISEYSNLLFKSGLFDFEFVRAQIDDSIRDAQVGSKAASDKLSHRELITFYFANWKTLGLDPHPLFDSSYYITDNKDVDFDIHEPLTHYLTQGWLDGLDPHPLFDTKFYLAHNLDVAAAAVNPLVHFAAHAMPHRIFSPFFANNLYVKARNKKSKITKASAKLVRQGMKWQRAFASATVPSHKFERAVLKTVSNNLLLDFLMAGASNRVYPLRSFLGMFDLSEVKFKPKKYHHLVKVLWKGSSRKKKYEGILASRMLTRIDCPMFDSNQDYVFLAAHEASRSGAPLLLLRLVKELTLRGNHCIVILKRGGPLEREFTKYAHVVNLELPVHLRLGGEECTEVLDCLFDGLMVKKPKFCILNSVETSGFASSFKKHEIKVVNLVHEILDSYDPKFLSAGFYQSDLKIFPAERVKQLAETKAGRTFSDSIVLPTAILDAAFGNFDKAVARHDIRGEIGASENSLIVLACGSPDLRKGIDLFVSAAKIVLAQTKADVHFVWVGASKKVIPHSIEYWVDWDIRTAGLSSLIHIRPGRADLRSAFNGSDIFVLPSRQDPFPCVAHDAMAAQLPIIAFENAGGVPEMIEHGAGIVVEYGNVEKLASAILQYVDNAERRLSDASKNIKMVHTKYSFEEYVNNLLKILVSTS